MSNKYKIVELFAGVGGFRLGLEKHGHKTVWANQYEPKTKVQHACECYKNKFKVDYTDLNTDIHEVDEKKIDNHDLLVGGFPCQDYSVATVSAKGIQGKKGVLWWDINRILEAKETELVLLENVDRLLRSPVTQRGRDFGVMLGCLAKLGYVVEWRVINAADYGFPQKRRRVFIFAAKKESEWGIRLSNKEVVKKWTSKGFFGKEFPVKEEGENTLSSDSASKLPKNIKNISNKFELHFFNSGIMVDNNIYTKKAIPIKESVYPLRKLLIKGVDKKYYIPKEDIEKWKYLKGAKKKEKEKDGVIVKWSEGAIPFPEDLKQPARTILTNEGGLGPSRFKHLVEDPWTEKLRTLTPEEAEKANCFPQGHTDTMPENWRYFCMGNALVVGLIERMGKQLKNGPN